MARPVIYCRFAALVTLAFVHVSAFAELSGSLESGLYSRYIWRGLRLSNGAVFQSTVAVSKEELSASLWHNYDLDDHELKEIDATLDWSRSIKAVDLSVGWTHYGLIDDVDSDEIYASAAFNASIVTPSLTVYWDVNEGRGAYVEAGLSRTFELQPKLQLELHGNLGAIFNNGYMATDENDQEFSGLFTSDLSSIFTYAVNDRFQVQARLTYAFPLTETAKYVASHYGFGDRADATAVAFVATIQF